MQLTFEASPPGVGAVYTPDHLVRFVVEAGMDRHGRLPEGRWIDPSCGDGAFLVHLVVELLDEVGGDALAEAVEERIFGLDVDLAACGEARQAVRSAVESRVGPVSSNYFERNVQCVDALATWPWGEGFGLVVGNPPYVGATALRADDKTRYLRDFATAWGRLDLYALFIERGVKALSEGGRLAMITPDKLLTAASCRPLRSFIVSNFAVLRIARFEDHDLFPGVATVPCVTSIARAAPHATADSSWWRRAGSRLLPVGDSTPVPLESGGAAWLPSATKTTTPVIKVGDIVERVSVGLATGLNTCFVLTSAEAVQLKIEPELLRPAVRGRDVQLDGIRTTNLVLLLPYSSDSRGKQRLIDLDAYPSAKAYLSLHETALRNRHCVRVWRKAWYDLHDPVVDDLSGVDKVVCPDITRTARFAHDPGQLLPLHSAYYLVPHAESRWSASELACALRTPEVEQQILDRAPTAKSGYRRVQAEVLKGLTLPQRIHEEPRLAA